MLLFPQNLQIYPILVKTQYYNINKKKLMEYLDCDRLLKTVLGIYSFMCQ